MATARQPSSVGMWLLAFVVNAPSPQFWKYMQWGQRKATTLRG